jgi:hypothetical protein
MGIYITAGGSKNPIVGFRFDRGAIFWRNPV